MTKQQYILVYKTLSKKKGAPATYMDLKQVGVTERQVKNVFGNLPLLQRAAGFKSKEELQKEVIFKTLGLKFS